MTCDVSPVAMFMHVNVFCHENCKKSLKQGNHPLPKLTILLQVTVNENTYTSQQAQKLRSQADLFSVSQIGQTIVVSSLKNQLWVEWQMDGTVEIGVGLNTKKLSTI